LSGAILIARNKKNTQKIENKIVERIKLPEQVKQLNDFFKDRAILILFSLILSYFLEKPTLQQETILQT